MAPFYSGWVGDARIRLVRNQRPVEAAWVTRSTGVVQLEQPAAARNVGQVLPIHQVFGGLEDLPARGVADELQPDTPIAQLLAGLKSGLHGLRRIKPGDMSAGKAVDSPEVAPEKDLPISP